MKNARYLLVAVFVFLACSDSTAPADPVPQEPAIVPPAVTGWIDANGVPFDGSLLTLPHTDLTFLSDLVGEARIVALGESTHGTRDFFEMKARILRYLVEEEGFDGFAIEATWPEANRLNRYVRTGVGDPALLLSALYFWTWNTESVLEMIEWMRAHNAAGGNVGFYGFDMQYPGMALHNVESFIADVDPGRTGEVATLLSCLVQYANSPDGRFPDPGYQTTSAAYQADCSSSLSQARELLFTNRATYEAASSVEEFEIALQSIRVAIQYHLSVTGELSRDQSMADNTVWLADQLGPASKLVLWAHNFHVSEQPGAQGFFLRSAFGDDMVVVGFSHEEGQFTAVRQGSGPTGLGPIALPPPLDFSYEFYLAGGTAPRFVLDLRNVDTTPEGASWLAGSRAFRFIGCCFDPGVPGLYWLDTPITQWFDVLIHYESTRATTLLPAQYPPEF